MGRIRINRVFVSRRSLGETLRPASYKPPAFKAPEFRKVDRPIVVFGLGGDLTERDVVNEQITREGTAEVWEPIQRTPETRMITRMRRLLTSLLQRKGRQP